MSDPQITQPLQGGTLNSVDGVTIVQSSGTISIPSSVPLPGSPTTTTQAVGDNSTKLATTAFVEGAIATSGTSENRIINGRYTVTQEREGASVTPASGATIIEDCVFAVVSAGLASKASAQVVTSSNRNWLKVTVSAQTAPGASDYWQIAHDIEGLHVADLKFGAATAKNIMVTFTVNTSIVGTYSGLIQNAALNRSYPFTFVIAQANTDTDIVVSIPGDTTGTWLTTNAIGLSLLIVLASGASGNIAAGAWSATASVTGATGGTNFINQANGSTFMVTDVRLRAGTFDVPYTPRLYAQELSLCQRTFEKTYPAGTVAAQNAAAAGALSLFLPGALWQSVRWDYKVEKRAVPTVLTFAPGSGPASGQWNASVGFYTPSVNPTSSGGVKGATIGASFSSEANGNSALIHATASARLR